VRMAVVLLHGQPRPVVVVRHSGGHRRPVYDV
jgi:hypothetical protein